jgi:hypothetical protein
MLSIHTGGGSRSVCRVHRRLAGVQADRLSHQPHRLDLGHRKMLYVVRHQHGPDRRGGSGDECLRGQDRLPATRILIPIAARLPVHLASGGPVGQLVDERCSARTLVWSQASEEFGDGRGTDTNLIRCSQRFAQPGQRWLSVPRCFDQHRRIEAEAHHWSQEVPGGATCCSRSSHPCRSLRTHSSADSLLSYSGIPSVGVARSA